MADTCVYVYDAGRFYVSVVASVEATDEQKRLIGLMDRTTVADRSRVAEMYFDKADLVKDWLMDHGLDPAAADDLVIRRRLPFQLGKPPLGRVPQVRDGYLAFRHPFLAKWQQPHKLDG